jgi:hypothetical protein
VLKNISYKLVTFASLFFASSLMPAHGAQKSLHVKADKMVEIGQSQSFLGLETLILEDGATLKIVGHNNIFALTAKDAYIGQDVKIIAAGLPGETGKAGKNANADPRENDDCSHGESGGDGQNGGVATSGKNITLQLGLSHFGSLSIDVSGGEGGDGGKGGDGRDFSQYDCSSKHKTAANGGNAGSGGAGGNGGNGGNVQLSYSLASSNSPPAMLLAARTATVVNTSGGRAELGALAGKSGGGSAGGYINKKTLTGSRAWKRGGAEGKKGEQGLNGSSGTAGTVDIRIAVINLEAEPNQQTIQESTRAEVKHDESSQLKTRIKILEDKVEALIKRLDVIEN